MNNIEKFNQLYIEFDKETKRKVQNNKTLSESIKELSNKRYNPYYRDYDFIMFCNELRNGRFHDNKYNEYIYITDELLIKLEKILDEVKHPFKVSTKATKPVVSKNIKDKVKDAIKLMNEQAYTHIPIYDDKKLVGIFSENCIFQYLDKNEIIEVNNDTTFNDILDFIKIENSKEVIKFVSKDILYDDVVNDFICEFKKNNKLSCIMVTKNGKAGEHIIGILTTWDIIGR